MAYINGNDVLLHVGGGNDLQTCTVDIASALGTTIVCVEATVFENGLCKRYAYEPDDGARKSKLTIENVVCGSLLYIYDEGGQTFRVSNGVSVIGEKYSNGYFFTTPTQTGTANIVIDV